MKCHLCSKIDLSWTILQWRQVLSHLSVEMSGGRATERIWGVKAGVWGLNSVAHLTFPDIPTLIVEIIHFLSKHPYFSFENSHKTESGYIGLCLFRCFLNWLWAVRWLAAVRKYPGTHLNYDCFSVCFRWAALASSLSPSCSDCTSLKGCKNGTHFIIFSFVSRTTHFSPHLLWQPFPWAWSVTCRLTSRKQFLCQECFGFKEEKPIQGCCSKSSDSRMPGKKLKCWKTKNYALSLISVVFSLLPFSFLVNRISSVPKSLW